MPNQPIQPNQVFQNILRGDRGNIIRDDSPNNLFSGSPDTFGLSIQKTNINATNAALHLDIEGSGSLIQISSGSSLLSVFRFDIDPGTEPGMGFKGFSDPYDVVFRPRTSGSNVSILTREFDAIIPATHTTPGEALLAGKNRLLVQSGTYDDTALNLSSGVFSNLQIKGEDFLNTTWVVPQVRVGSNSRLVDLQIENGSSSGFVNLAGVSNCELKNINFNIDSSNGVDVKLNVSGSSNITLNRLKFSNSSRVDLGIYQSTNVTAHTLQFNSTAENSNSLTIEAVSGTNVNFVNTYINNTLVKLRTVGHSDGSHAFDGLYYTNPLLDLQSIESKYTNFRNINATLTGTGSGSRTSLFGNTNTSLIDGGVLIGSDIGTSFYGTSVMFGSGNDNIFRNLKLENVHRAFFVSGGTAQFNRNTLENISSIYNQDLNGNWNLVKVETQPLSVLVSGASVSNNLIRNCTIDVRTGLPSRSSNVPVIHGFLDYRTRGSGTEFFNNNTFTSLQYSRVEFIGSAVSLMSAPNLIINANLNPRFEMKGFKLTDSNFDRLYTPVFESLTNVENSDVISLEISRNRAASVASGAGNNFFDISMKAGEYVIESNNFLNASGSAFSAMIADNYVSGGSTSIGPRRSVITQNRFTNNSVSTNAVIELQSGSVPTLANGSTHVISNNTTINQNGLVTPFVDSSSIAVPTIGGLDGWYINSNVYGSASGSSIETGGKFNQANNNIFVV